VTAETALKVGDRLLIEYHGSWWDAEVLAVQSDGQVRIRYDGFDSSWDETVPRSRLNLDASAVTDEAPLKVGDAVQVEWYGQWWTGEVLGLEGDNVRIHYRGFDSRWDETVPRSRLRLGQAESEPAFGGGTAFAMSGERPPPPLRFSGDNTNAGRPVGPQAALRPGDRVQIEQHAAWWAGEVLEAQADGRVKVRYTGWGSHWDEVVPRSRLRLDVPGAWEGLEGQSVQLHLDGGTVLVGVVQEVGADYLLLTPADGRQVLVNRGRMLYCEVGG
jgi:hypothetical protein